MPAIVRPPPRERPRDEATIQWEIRRRLGRPPFTGPSGFLALRRNAQVATDIYDEKRGGAKFVSGGLGKGTSDIIGLVQTVSGVGRFFAIEVKTPEGRATPEQLEFLALVNRLGGYGCICRSADEAEQHAHRAREGLSAP